ncbi:MAG: hypothetical protein HDQ95_16220 [Roseburia sp.]|nr:hypothetical protein [Roseburia sp.]
MNDKLFRKLWEDALVQPNLELYIGEYGYPEWYNEIVGRDDEEELSEEELSEVVRTLTAIHEVAHMSVRDIISEAGMTLQAFSDRFCIPLRTVERWAAGERECSSHQRLGFCRQLHILSF